MSQPAQSYVLGHRISALLALMTLLGLGLVCLSIYGVVWLSLADKESTELRGKSELMRHLLAETPTIADVPGMRHKLDDFLFGHGDLRISLSSATEDSLYVSRQPAGWTGNFREASFKLPWKGVAGGVVLMRVQMDRSANEKLLTGLAWTLVLTTMLAATIMSWGGFYLVRMGLKPLNDLARQTSEVAADRLGQRLSAEGYAAELQPWIRQFNELLGRLEQAYQQLEGFNADVAHELRTPLATLISRSELDLNHGRSHEEYRDTIASNLEELRRMSGIISDMLFLSQADRGAQARVELPSSLAHQIADVVSFHEAAIEEADVSVCIVGDAAFPFDKRLIRRAISNLLSNATRYAEFGSTIKASVLIDPDGAVVLSIENQGLPIPADKLSQFFDRFFRVESARERSSENHGLGLAIVAAIARMHGGRPFALSEQGVTSIGIEFRSQRPLNLDALKANS